MSFVFFSPAATTEIYTLSLHDALPISSLGVEVTLYCDEPILQQLQRLGDELRFVLITSTAEVRPASEAAAAEPTAIKGLQLAVHKSEHAKCARCWHHRADVGANTAHPEICLRCVDNVEGQGEVRYFA